MGQVLASGLGAIEGFSVVTLVDVNEPRELFAASYVATIDEVDANSVDVVVDFSTPEGVVDSAKWCASKHVALVIGTTGLSDAQHGAVQSAAESTSVVMASNYAIGEVLSERFAAMAAPYFDRVEIIELHHDKKADAPSGTSITTARAIARARMDAQRVTPADPTSRFSVEGARGAQVDGVVIHSVRLPGLVAHQEILFGGPGEGLTIRHDSFDRQSFVQGVALAVRSISSDPGLTIGIGSFLA